MSLRIAAVVALAFLAQTANAGPLNGNAKYDNSRANAHSTVTYDEVFRGGEWAHARIVGDGDTDLDLFVYDEMGNRVAANTNRIDRASVSWFPLRNSRYRIVVENLGGVYNAFEIEVW